MFGLQRYALSDSVERWVSHDGGTITFSGQTRSGKPFQIVTYLNDANAWINGESIQNAFHYLTAEEREIMLTGMDDECWENTFAKGE